MDPESGRIIVEVVLPTLGVPRADGDTGAECVLPGTQDLKQCTRSECMTGEVLMLLSGQ